MTDLKFLFLDPPKLLEVFLGAGSSCWETGEQGRCDGASAVDWPLGGGGHSHFDKSGAETSNEEAHFCHARLVAHDGPLAVEPEQDDEELGDGL